MTSSWTTNSRYLRQLRAGERVASALDAGAPLDADDAIARLARIRNIVHGRLYLTCMDRWLDMVLNGDVTAISAVLRDDSEEGGRMRTVSPFGNRYSIH